MSEERLDRIAQKLDNISHQVDGLAEWRHEATGRFDGLAHGLEATNIRLDSLAIGQDDLRRQMLVLHEDVIDRIKVLAPDFGPIRREFTAADEQLRESLDRRLSPLEAAARSRKRTE